MIASRSEKLCATSHAVHLSRAASSSINTELIQTNAIKKSNNKMSVRGRAATCVCAKKNRKNRKKDETMKDGRGLG